MQRDESNSPRCFAYADPPYPGLSRLYKDHPDYAGEVDHRELIDRLEADFSDGWALSTSVTALRDVLELCPRPVPSKGGTAAKAGTGVRVCAWSRGPSPMGRMRVMYSWEPVILRAPHWRQRQEGDYVRDMFHGCSPYRFMGGQIIGQKPAGFTRWLFDLFGARPGDGLVDLFPGSGAVGTAWQALTAQERLAA